MTLKAPIRRELDKVHGATTTARLVLETIRACLRYRVTGLASEAAFFMLLSLPPLVLALFGGVGYVGQIAGRATVEHVTAAIREYASQFLTKESITQVLLPTVDDVFRGGRFEVVSLGFLLALWSGSRALNVFVDTIAIMYGQSGVRGIVRTRALSFSLYLTALVFGVVIIPLVLLGPTLIDRWLPDSIRFLAVLYWPVVVVATVAALTTLFHVATPHRAPWWRDAPGAVLALAIWVLASFVVRGTVGASLGGTSIYGPLSAPIVVLIWLYALAIAVLIGAGLNSATRVLWPVEARPSSTTRLVEWARTEVERRRSGSQGEFEDEVLDEVLDDLMAQEQQFVDRAWEDRSSRVRDTPWRDVS
ncbi:MAG: YihY/virulence factor BrkB family protein [Lapillicoccus sp.]